MGSHAAPVEGSTNSDRPSFDLQFLGGDFCLTRCDQELRAAFADTLHRLSQLTWEQICLAPRYGLGFETIPREAIRAKLPAHVTEDVRPIAFRFAGKRPMLGYRRGRLFVVLFLDRDFTLYDHG